MNWTRLMIGVVLLLNPSGIHAQDVSKASDSVGCISPATCYAGDLKFSFIKDETDSKKLQMCLMESSSESCERCYSLVKKKCDSGYCWSFSDTSRINNITGILGGTIAMLVVVMIASIVVFVYTSYKYKEPVYKKQKNSSEVKMLVEDVTPKAARRPTHTLKEKPEKLKLKEEDDGYLHGSEIEPVKPYLVAQMGNEKSLCGNVEV